MPYRINGTGTTISPMPELGEHAITMHWVTFVFVPIIPLGWQLVKGMGGNEYKIIRELTYSEVKKTLGIKGMLLTIGFGFCSNIAMLLVFIALAFLVTWFKS